MSISNYKDNFLLKGGSLLYAMDGLDSRPTVDVDFMAMQISRDRDYLENVFKEVLSIECAEDGVTFDVDRLRTEPIAVEKKYPGTRFYINAKMDTIEYNMSIDIGFGDVVTPCPVTIEFPLLLQEIPGIQIKAYSIETVIAEKFHAMIDRDEKNSRMKDFFDCYQILKTKEISSDTLNGAIYATFENRGLRFNGNLKLFSEEFARDNARVVRWNAFLRKIRWKEMIPFDVVMDVITSQLKPYYDNYWSIHR
ncbi:MAG: nucleotidyl transferase AbiEii/AbiGii toxin family protein [Bacteroidaceae bacterium]|nr:nucleotidyl transferase AbiEii/AbiGii toxin family protein [Bacteroidaceae bacterium]